MITELRMFADMTGGNQKKFFEFQLASAKVVKCVPLKELFSNEEIKLIKRLVKPQKKECYKNAHLMTNYFSGVEYVEGKVKLECGISVEHAFNRKGDKYFDITWELALNDKTDGVEYLSIGEYDQETINQIAVENGVYGDIFRSMFLNKNLINHYGTQSSKNQRF